MDSSAIDALCRMAQNYKSRGDVSMSELAREVGSLTDGASIPQDEVEAYLRRHPELVVSWLIYSQDKRCSPTSYLAEPGAGLDGPEGWRVGYYRAKNRPTERVFTDEFAACAFFIARELDQLGNLWVRRVLRRWPSVS